MAITKQLTAVLKGVLEKENQRLTKELNRFASGSDKGDTDYKSKFPDYGDDEDENAQEVAEYGTRLSLENTLEKELRDVESALKRIETDAYGKCKYCGQDIPEERLRARPTSSACIACKTKLKSSG
jgi:DnaK suppressor protein